MNGMFKFPLDPSSCKRTRLVSRSNGNEVVLSSFLLML